MSRAGVATARGRAQCRAAYEQAVLFYVYCPDVAAMHAQLAADGLEPGPIFRPFFNPEGEFRLVDPDRYVVIVACL